MWHCKTETTPRRRRSRRGEEGVAMVVVLVLIMVITAFGTLHLLSSRANHDMVMLSERSTRALNIAEAGIARTLSQLTRDAATPPDTSFRIQTSFDRGRYVVDVSPLGGRRFLVQSWGEITVARAADGSPTELVRRGLEVIVGPRPASTFSRALASRTSILIDGGATFDSYDSKLGPYFSQADQSDELGTYARPAGHVGSSGSITLSDEGTVVRGDANPGPAGSLQVLDEALHFGNGDPLPEALDLPDLSESEFVQVRDSNSNGYWWASPGVVYDSTTKSLSVPSGESLLLHEGDYYFSSIDIAAGGSFKSLGPANVYLGGNMHVNGGLMGVGDGVPGISILAHPIELPPEGEEGYQGPPHIDLKNIPSIKLTLYAPQYDVLFQGSGDVYGAAVGANVHVNGNRFHYDEALAYDAGQTISQYAKVSWRELGMP